MTNYYKAMPEEFYSCCDLPIISPENCEEFIRMASNHRIDLQEIFFRIRTAVYCRYGACERRFSGRFPLRLGSTSTTSSRTPH